MALNDSSPLLALAKHLQDPNILSENFETEIRGYLKQKVRKSCMYIHGPCNLIMHTIVGYFKPT